MMPVYLISKPLSQWRSPSEFGWMDTPIRFAEQDERRRFVLG
jgi:hypothetical protein